MERNIRVTGKGEISVKPDTISLLIEAKGVYPEYEKTIEESAKHTNILRKVLENSGLNGKELKTQYFSIDTEYENYRDHNDNYQRRFVGYAYHHNLGIQFPNDNKQLGRTLYALSHCPVAVEFTIRYTVKDVEAVKNELLKKAVEDSVKKAEILSQAAGVKLVDVQTIDYSRSEISIYSQPMNNLKAMALTTEEAFSESYDIDIEADDIELNDTVTIEWGIQ